MAEYIKREDALGCVLGVFDRQRIKELPAADVEEVKHGKWVKSSVIKCSVCGSCTDIQSDEAYEKFIESYCYCPVCGSKLDLED
mgnify:CR=1